MILTLQQGGGIPPFADYIPVDTSSGSTTERPSKDKKEDDLGIKDIIELIKGVEGLPNDSLYLTKQLNSLLNRASVYPLRNQDIASAFSQIFASVQRLKHHKSEYTKAAEEAKNNGALSEVAITDSGLLVAYDLENNKVTTISTDVARQSSQYKVLTNSDLLNLNSQNANYIFDNSLLDVVENGIGMTKIDQFIRNAVSSLGTDEASQKGYSVQEQNDIIAGLKVIKEHQQGMPLDGIYQNEALSKTQKTQAMKALQYVYAMLPDNAKTLLRYKTGSDERALSVIQDYIQSKTSNTRKLESTYPENVNNDKLGNKDDKLPNLTEVEKWLYGYGFKEQFNLVGGTSDAIPFTSTVLSMTDKGNPIGQTTLQKAIGGDFNGVLDTRYVTMGNQIIDTNALDKVILKDGRIYKVELPLNMELYNQGIIAPDYNYSRNKEAADLEIKEKGVTDKQEINAIYEKHNLPIKYDEKGEVITTHYATFGALHAVAMDKAFLQNKSDLDLATYLNEVSDEQGVDNILSIYKRLNGISDKDKSTSGWDYNDWGKIEGDYDAFYEGVLYIPVQAHFANAKVGQSISPAQMTELQQMQTVSDTSNELKTVGWNDRK